MSASTRNFTSPSVSSFVFARELATMGNDPTLYLIPAALSSSSVFPTHATWRRSLVPGVRRELGRETHFGVGVNYRGDGLVVDVSVARVNELDSGDTCDEHSASMISSRPIHN